MDLINEFGIYTRISSPNNVTFFEYSEFEGLIANEILLSTMTKSISNAVSLFQFNLFFVRLINIYRNVLDILVFLPILR